jgi:hypothetical protein
MEPLVPSGRQWSLGTEIRTQCVGDRAAEGLHRRPGTYGTCTAPSIIKDSSDIYSLAILPITDDNSPGSAAEVYPVRVDVTP